jgi:prepilin-type N-terminal cleavage/methylation domain-containing protein
MKTFPKNTGKRTCQGFTLLEMMVASFIYLTIFITALISLQIFAMRVYTLGATKLTATQGCRKTLDIFRDDVRQGKLIQVGNVTDNSYDSFTPVAVTNNAVGNAIQIFQTTNTSAGAPMSIYYLQTNYTGTMSSNNIMAYLATATGTNLLKLTTYVTNSVIFAAVDCWGSNIVNQMNNNQVYTITLQYYQWEYPIGYIGGQGFNAYDYYQLRTRVCRRATD